MFLITNLWDFVSFFIVLGGSGLVWLIRYICKKKWNFIYKNISWILGIMYSVIWNIQLVLSGKTESVLYVSLIPVLYGIILEFFFYFIYWRRYHEE